jgi:hypothetical protein
MEPDQNFKESNFTFTKPEGMDNCGDLKVYKGVSGQYPIIISKFKPTEKDIKRIVEGGSVYLDIVSSGMPPVSVYTEHPFDTEVDKPSRTILSYSVNNLIDALNNDEDYRRSWIANIAISFQDVYNKQSSSSVQNATNEGVLSLDIHKLSNEAAENFLNNLCKIHNNA